MPLITRLLLAFALLGTSGLALAERHGHGDHDRRGQQHGQRDHRQHRSHVERRHVDYRRHDSRRDYRHDRRYYGSRHDYRHDRHRYGYRPVYHPHYRHTRWVRGQRYGGPTYVVRDYGYYRLRPPPRGYHWVRADNDFLLVAITTGIILDLALR
jgi:Ni/Co efflux regulator RcnB